MIVHNKIAMQTSENNKNGKKSPVGRLQSYTRYLNQIPTYIVAYAFDETDEDIATNQMECNNNSSLAESSSLSSTSSSKTLTDDHSSIHQLTKGTCCNTLNKEINIYIDEKGGDQLEDIKIENVTLENKNEGDHNSEGNRNDKRQYVLDENSLNNAKNEDNTDQVRMVASPVKYIIHNDKLADIYRYIYRNIILHGINNFFDKEKVEENLFLRKNDSLVNKFATAQSQETNKTLKKKRRIHNNIRKINFKYTRNSSKNKETDKKRSTVGNFKKTTSSNKHSRNIFKTSFLKKRLSQNTLDVNIRLGVPTDIIKSDISSPSSLTSNNKLMTSNSSRDAAIEKSCSELGGGNDSEIVDFVTAISREESVPYKTDFINVALVTTCSNNENEIFVNNTKIKTGYTDVLPCSSKSSGTSKCYPKCYLKSSNSNKNLTYSKYTSSSDANSVSTLNNYYGPDSSSDSKRQFPYSEDTLTPNSESFICSENLKDISRLRNLIDKDREFNGNLQDNVISEKNAASCSGKSVIEKEVFLTTDHNYYLSNLQKPLRDINVEGTKNVLKKSFNFTSEYSTPRVFNLPNEYAIKESCKEKVDAETKLYSGDTAHCPFDINKLMERHLIMMVQTTKEVSGSIAEKVITEIKRFLAKYINDNKDLSADINNIPIIDIKNDERDFMDLKTNLVEEGLQCDIVNSNFIDNLVMKLNVESPMVHINEISKSFKLPTLADGLGVMKPSEAETIDLGPSYRGDALFSLAVSSKLEECNKFQQAISVLTVPLRFVRQNMMIVSSVPAFFLVILCIYGFILLVVKP